MAATANQTRTSQVVEILTKEILTGQYRAGERLPSERELATRFETNRGAIREALKKLEQLGIASVQPGGTRVAPIGEATLDVIGALLEVQGYPSPTLVAHMIETLEALTVVAVRATVERASDEDLNALSADIQRMGGELDDAEIFMESFANLTRRLMQTSGNLVLRLISNSLHMQLANRRRPIPEHLSLDPEILARLDEGLRNRLPDVAAEALSRLMQTAGRQIVEAAEHASQKGVAA